MIRTLFAAILVLLMATGARAAPLELRHGVGLHEWLNWSPLASTGRYRWPPYRHQKEWLGGGRPLSDWPIGNEFKRIRAMGFDFIRLSVDPGPLLDSKGARQQHALDILEMDVRRITNTGLTVVFNLHGNSQVPAYGMDVVNGGADSEEIRHYRQIVTAVARMLAKVGPDKVLLEPYNEPAHYPCDASGTDDWQRIMAATVADIRAVSPDLPIIVTGACGGNISGLVNLDPAFDDPGIYYSFHMYEPHSFTHQRLDDPKGFSSGLPWPAASGTAEMVIAHMQAHMATAGLNDYEQAGAMAIVRPGIDEYFAEDWGLPQMQARIAEATDWAKAHDIPTGRLFMGEFGAMLISPDGRTGADDADRLRYLTALRQEAERHGIPWSIWEYSNPYGMSVISPTGPAVPDEALLEALGLP
jgi:hypothetical protein